MGACIFGVYFHFFVDNYWNEENLFRSVLLFAWLTFFWELYLSFRQYKMYVSVTTVPVEFAGVLDQTTLTKARLYNIDKYKFGFVNGIWDQCLSTVSGVILLTNVLPFLWKVSGDVLVSVGLSEHSEILRTVLFAMIGSFLSTIINTPWSMYNTFVVEEKHGFNNQTIGFYFKDKVKKFLVSQVISSLVIAAATFIIKSGGQYFFIYLWLFCSLVVFLFMTV
ncbi:CAAX prenyl protease 1-like protein, partial [Leptotrombidium deliense]